MGNVSTVDLTVLPKGTALDAIKKIVEKEGFILYNIHVEAGSSKGDNYSGPIYRLVVTGNGKNNQPKHLKLIVKCSVRLEVKQGMRNMYNAAFRREARMYTDIIPTFEKMQANANVKNGLAPLAKLYGYSLTVGDEYLIFQDQKDLNFLMKNRQQTLDLQHCKLILKQLGYLHAFSLALKKTNPELRKLYCASMKDEVLNIFVEGEMVGFLDEHLKLKIEKALNTLDPIEDKDVRERFETFSTGIRDRLKLFIAPELADEYYVVMHGDCWINNILFRYADKNYPEAPSEICLLDWQISRWASPAIDLSYFIYYCTGTDLRKNHFDEMIEFYYERSSWMIKQLGADPNEVFPRDALQKHMEKFFSFGVMMAINTIPLFISDKDEIPNLKGDMYDTDKAEAWNFVSKNNDVFVERMGGILRHAASKNYFQ